MPANPFSTYGRLALNLPYYGGKTFIVCPASSTFYSMLSEEFPVDEDGVVRLYTSLSAAYDNTVSGRNDVILLTPGTHALTTGLTISKNRVHFEGWDWTSRVVQQPALISLSGAVNSAFVLKVTGTRCSFRNLKVIQSSTHANAINVIQYAGEGNLWENVSCLFGVADNIDLTTASEALMGEDSGTFIRCSWGTDVLLSSGGAGRAVMRLDAISGASSADGAKSNRFVDCEWFIMSSSADANLILLQDTAGAKFLNSFENARLSAVINNTNSAIAITNAIASAAGFVEGTLAFWKPMTINCTNGCTTADNVRIAGAPVFSSNAWEGGTPA
jgi:hypothetical protein